VAIQLLGTYRDQGSPIFLPTSQLVDFGDRTLPLWFSRYPRFKKTEFFCSCVQRETCAKAKQLLPSAASQHNYKYPVKLHFLTAGWHFNCKSKACLGFFPDILHSGSEPSISQVEVQALEQAPSLQFNVRTGA